MTKKSKQKFKNLGNERAFKVNEKHFSSFLKDFQLSKFALDLRVRL